MLGNVIMREGLLPGSSYWVPVYAGVSKHSTADETEFGKTQVVRAGREDREEGAMQTNCSIILNFGLNTKLCIYRAKIYEA